MLHIFHGFLVREIRLRVKTASGGRSSKRKGRLPRIVKEGYEVVMTLCISTDTKEPMGIFSEGGGGGYLGVEIVKQGVRSSVVGQGIGTCPGSHSE